MLATIRVCIHFTRVEVFEEWGCRVQILYRSFLETSITLKKNVYRIKKGTKVRMT